jgi:hypothetical protein
MNPVIRTYYGRNVPPPMTNAERLARYRAAAAVVGFNNYRWKFRA